LESDIYAVAEEKSGKQWKKWLCYKVVETTFPEWNKSKVLREISLNMIHEVAAKSTMPCIISN